MAVQLWTKGEPNLGSMGEFGSFRKHHNIIIFISIKPVKWHSDLLTEGSIVEKK